MLANLTRHLTTCGLLFLAHSAVADDIANDPFTDGSRTNTTGGDPLGLVYYRNTTSTSAPLTVSDDSAGIGTGNALLFSPNADLLRYFANFTPVTLPAAGDSILLTFDYRFTVAPPSAGDGLRFGLYFSNNTRQTSEPGGTIRNDDKGYAVTMNPGATGTFRVQKEDTNGSDDILGGAVYFSSISATNGSCVAVGTTKHSLTFQITRLVGGDLEVRGQMDALTPSVATVAAASVLTYRFDEFAIGTAAGARGPYFLDNIRIVTSASGMITLDSPMPDAVLAAPASLTLSTTASDPNGIAKVEFFDFGTKIGTATSAPYTLSLPNPAPGIYGLTAVMTDLGGSTTSTPIVYVRVNAAASDEYDALREKWRTILTGGDSFAIDSDTQARINSTTSSANASWSTMDTSPGRAWLWSDLTSTTISAQITSNYTRLRSMALALRTHGSTLENNATLRADIIGGLDWLYTNRYNETKTYYDNWYDWEIGSPQYLLDIVTLVHDSLTPTQVGNYMAATNKFTPLGTVSPVIGVTTGANRIWEMNVVALRSIVLKKAAALSAARDGLSPVFDYVTSSDGFYVDGSFIQHTKHPYTGGYGVGLLSSLASMMELLAGSSWQVTDPDAANIYRWVNDAFEPTVYRGACMEMLRGRDISRSGSPDHVVGHNVLQSVQRLGQIAPAPTAAELKSLAKSWIQTDTYRNTLTSDTLSTVLYAKQILADTSIVAKPELTGHWTYGSMDRVVHRRPGFGFGVSMNSSRIYRYESINGENLRGWFTSDGSTWLYNDDLGQFNDFWPTVNPYRIPGTTVDTQARADSSGQSTASAFTWTGGATLAGSYGAAGMELAGYGTSLTARKSWFMFDDEVVALGSGINSTDNRTIETIVENRKLNTAGTNVFTADGIAQPTTLGWSGMLSGVGWSHIEGVGGYYFPGGTTVKALREARTGSWSLVNTGGSTSTLTRNYLTLWLDHGSNPSNAGYAYVLLPNKTAAETSAYAASPQILVLENSPSAHGVKETALGICAVNFWTDTSHTVDTITSDRKASVLTRESATQIDLAVSDPTQANTGTIVVEIARSATAIVSADPAVTVQQLSPTIRASINVAGAAGRTFSASFSLLPAVSVIASLPAAAELGPVAGAFVISRTGSPSSPLTVPFQLAGTALAGADYQPLGSSITFAANETSRTIVVTPIADNLAEGNETVELRLQTGANYTLVPSTSATVTIADKPFDDWRFTHGLTLSSELADPDGDGSPNLLEYAVGSDPNISAKADFPTLSLVAGQLTLTYQRLRPAAELEYRAEVSGDLLTWNNGVAFVEEILQPDGFTVVARDLAPAGSIHRFIRLRVIRSP